MHSERSSGERRDENGPWGGEGREDAPSGYPGRYWNKYDTHSGHEDVQQRDVVRSERVERQRSCSDLRNTRLASAFLPAKSMCGRERAGVGPVELKAVPHQAQLEAADFEENEHHHRQRGALGTESASLFLLSIVFRRHGRRPRAFTLHCRCAPSQRPSTGVSGAPRNGCGPGGGGGCSFPPTRAFALVRVFLSAVSSVVVESRGRPTG